jgi:hypothetical protein
VPWPRVVQCNFTDAVFAEALFDVYLNDFPLNEIDLFWTDFGGCGSATSNQLFWSNYLFNSNPKGFRNQTDRSLVLSRYGEILFVLIVWLAHK